MRNEKVCLREGSDAIMPAAFVEEPDEKTLTRRETHHRDTEDTERKEYSPCSPCLRGELLLSLLCVFV
jgi:hypothetical protein